MELTTLMSDAFMSSYMHDGKQYVVIAVTGQANSGA